MWFNHTRSVIVNARPGTPTIGSTGGDVKFAVYPNPTSGVLTVETPVMGVFTVYTIDGKEMMSNEIKEATTTITLPNNIANGVYMCRFHGEDESVQVVRLILDKR